MAADLHIHIFEDYMTEEHLRLFFSSHMGSKYFSPFMSAKAQSKTFNIKGKELDAYSIVANTPNVWVCEVSWLKANLSNNYEKYIPSVAESIISIFGEDLIIIDDDLIQEILLAVNSYNSTQCSRNDSKSIIEFLEAHKGKKCFTVSW